MLDVYTMKKEFCNREKERMNFIHGDNTFRSFFIPDGEDPMTYIPPEIEDEITLSALRDYHALTPTQNYLKVLFSLCDSEDLQFIDYKRIGHYSYFEEIWEFCVLTPMSINGKIFEMYDEITNQIFN